MKQLKGVCFDPRLKLNPYQARIQVGKKYIGLGSFPTAEEAHRAYLAKRAIHPRPPCKPRDVRLCSREEAMHLLSYCAETGIITWRNDRKPDIKGSFNTIDEAHAAYLRLAEICYGEFAPTKQSHYLSHAARMASIT